VIQWREAFAGHGELGAALDAIRWGTDYFIKAHPEANVLWAQVGVKLPI
jgi:hypothetical protein